MKILMQIPIAIFNGIKFIFLSIKKGIVYVVQSFINLIEFSVNLLYRVFILPFLPSYKVVFSLYHVIPGIPIGKKDQTHSFDKGKGDEARNFYQKVVEATATKNIVPAEVHLIKRRKVVATKQFGPVQDIKVFM